MDLLRRGKTSPSWLFRNLKIEKPPRIDRGGFLLVEVFN
jgi:hypothetical protein